MKIYKSKLGLSLVLPLILVLGAALYLTASEKPHWIGPAILLPVILFIGHMLTTTYYVIDEDTLLIKSGFFTTTIDIKGVKKISETNNPISSPALSLDRIELTYGKFQSVIISPKLKKEFIEGLTRLKSAIEVKDKKVA